VSRQNIGHRTLKTFCTWNHPQIRSKLFGHETSKPELEFQHRNWGQLWRILSRLNLTHRTRLEYNSSDHVLHLRHLHRKSDQSKSLDSKDFQYRFFFLFRKSSSDLCDNSPESWTLNYFLRVQPHWWLSTKLKHKPLKRYMRWWRKGGTFLKVVRRRRWEACWRDCGLASSQWTQKIMQARIPKSSRIEFSLSS